MNHRDCCECHACQWAAYQAVKEHEREMDRIQADHERETFVVVAFDDSDPPLPSIREHEFPVELFGDDRLL